MAALEASSEHNVVRLILPREDPTAAQDRYARAAATLRRWRELGVLVPDDVPALYVYEQAAPGGHVQRGLVGALGLTPDEDGIVLPHENTMAGPVSDRLALYTAVEADLEPIFLVHDGGGAAAAAVASAGRPDGPALLLDAVLADGLRHRVWALTDAAVLAGVAADLHPRRALIADGHHRYATYLRRQAERHEAGRGPRAVGLRPVPAGRRHGVRAGGAPDPPRTCRAGRRGPRRRAPQRASPCADSPGDLERRPGRARRGRHPRARVPAGLGRRERAAPAERARPGAARRGRAGGPLCCLGSTRRERPARLRGARAVGPARRRGPRRVRARRRRCPRRRRQDRPARPSC